MDRYTTKDMENPQGHLHPLSQITDRSVSILGELGFITASGPLIEDEYYNFDALNVPKDHPARDMQDTFWLRGEQGKVLRTHTSPVQVRYMEKHKPPIRIVVPGKVFRNEATDATHEAQFFQIEGLAVDTNISLAHLKGTLDYFFKKLYGEEARVRFRPTYFPFVEPGLEVDVWFRGKWLEILGAGMVHPNVLSNAGINHREFSGFAFGGGLDRLAMIAYQVPDVRLFYQGDMRFLSEF